MDADIYVDTHLKAMDGKTGEVLWAYEYQFEDDSILQYARFNFYNGALVADQNNDGLKDLLIINGGNSKAAPGASIRLATGCRGRSSAVAPRCRISPRQPKWAGG